MEYDHMHGQKVGVIAQVQVAKRIMMFSLLMIINILCSFASLLP